MRTSVVLLLFLISPQAFCQTNVVGNISDATTHQPLPYSSVYLNLTTIGVYSDGQGNFTLKNIPPGKHELIVSHVGYVTSQTTFEVRDSTELTFNIRLVAVTLKEVSVSAKKDKRWNDQLKRFNTLFFGRNAHLRQCRIMNPWVLEFTEDAAGRFSATASSNLIIENLGLGYKISYQLKKFEFTPSAYSILGATWFQEIPTYDTALLNMWTRERRKVYFGSVTHLLASMTRRSLQKDGFELYQDITHSPDVIRKSTFTSNLNRAIAPLDIADLVKKGRGPGQYFLTLPPRTEVHYVRGKSIPTIYRNVAVPISWIEVKNGAKLEVSGSGIMMNPAAMTLSGAMSEPKIADLLPIDYNPGSPENQRPVANDQVAKAQYLVERTHVHTDKTFYYPGEKIWYKAYVNYSSPAYQDTLSNVLHLDLVNSKNEVVTSRLLLIDTIGTAAGSIDLLRLGADTYQLRASTRWMLNYDKSFIFTKTIRILEDDDLIAARPLDTVRRSDLIEVAASRQVYSPGDKAVITIRTRDADGFSLAGDVSVSITPFSHSSLGKEDPDIYPRLSFTDNPATTPGLTPFSIQYGIDITGKADMKTRKRKYRQPIVMLAQEGTADLISTRAEDDGSFAFKGLQLYDTVKLSIQAVSLKGNRRGLIKIDSAAKVIIPAMPFSPLTARIVKAERPRRPVAPELGDSVQMLEEVTIESTRTIKVTGSATHLQVDIVVSGEDLRNSDNGDLIAMIQSRVPGLRVLTYVENGIVRKYFKLGGGISSFDNNRQHLEPIVIIDGSVISNQWGESCAEQVGRLTASMIDRIEVIRFGGGAAYGARGANGVIAIYTRSDFDKSKIIDNYDRSLFTPIRVRGLTSPDKFKGYQSYSTGSTIYWNPSVNLKREGDTSLPFNVPHVRGKYAVHVEGLSSDGRPLKAMCVIEVAN